MDNNHFLETPPPHCCRGPSTCPGTARCVGGAEGMDSCQQGQHWPSPLHWHWVLPTRLLGRSLRAGEARRGRKLGVGGMMGHLLSPTQATPLGEVVSVVWGGASLGKAFGHGSGQRHHSSSRETQAPAPYCLLFQSALSGGSQWQQGICKALPSLSLVFFMLLMCTEAHMASVLPKST